MDKLDALTMKMTEYFSGDPKRIQHFIKVHSFARLIGKGEGLDTVTQFTLEAAALVHDIGIKPAEEKYGNCSGKLQEQEGPAPARKMLTELHFEESVTERVVYLVAHHHTYDGISELDYQILVEADFLVNLYEDALPEASVQTAYEKIFRTETGMRILREMFALNQTK